MTQLEPEFNPERDEVLYNIPVESLESLQEKLVNFRRAAQGDGNVHIWGTEDTREVHLYFYTEPDQPVPVDVMYTSTGWAIIRPNQFEAYLGTGTPEEAGHFADEIEQRVAYYLEHGIS